MMKVVCKTMMMLSTMVFAQHVEAHLFLAVCLIVLSLLLTVTGIIFDPFAANQKSAGRIVEPNNVTTACDTTTVYIYLCSVGACIDPTAKGLIYASYSTPLIFVAGYFIRDPLKRCFIAIARLGGCARLAPEDYLPIP
eukprot:NODE_5153_length_609_cov_1.833935.p2 GENE.NODE_5153_length_609_cov_1.833935~~NODE_5153_length_609_cov_1.833935.p2  ORF type:complete len:155 (+),score=37.83 NODE_5153_length_609_cov_1.833935:54-467(+)